MGSQPRVARAARPKSGVSPVFVTVVVNLTAWPGSEVISSDVVVAFSAGCSTSTVVAFCVASGSPARLVPLTAIVAG